MERVPGSPGRFSCVEGCGQRDSLITRFPVDHLGLEINLIRMVFQEIHAEHTVEWWLLARQVDDHGRRFFDVERADIDMSELDSVSIDDAATGNPCLEAFSAGQVQFGERRAMQYGGRCSGVQQE